jgi:hypothetical protein
VGLFAVSSLVHAQRGAASHQLAASALTVDHARRLARLSLHAGMPHGSQPELNFNGTSRGELELRVPTGWTVELRFDNVGTARHSVRVVGDHDLPVELGEAVFANAQSPESLLGSLSGTVHRVSFVADRAGRYRIACAVPAHGFAGMWIRLTVDHAIRVPATVEHAGEHAGH